MSFGSGRMRNKASNAAARTAVSWSLRVSINAGAAGSAMRARRFKVAMVESRHESSSDFRFSASSGMAGAATWPRRHQSVTGKLSMLLVLISQELNQCDHRLLGRAVDGEKGLSDANTLFPVRNRQGFRKSRNRCFRLGAEHCQMPCGSSPYGRVFVNECLGQGGNGILANGLDPQARPFANLNRAIDRHFHECRRGDSRFRIDPGQQMNRPDSTNAVWFFQRVPQHGRMAACFGSTVWRSAIARRRKRRSSWPSDSAMAAVADLASRPNFSSTANADLRIPASLSINNPATASTAFFASGPAFPSAVRSSRRIAGDLSANAAAISLTAELGVSAETDNGLGRGKPHGLALIAECLAQCGHGPLGIGADLAQGNRRPAPRCSSASLRFLINAGTAALAGPPM